jgi:hypothetical protein
MRRLPFVFFVSALIGSLSLGVLWSTVAQADSKRHFTLEVAMGDSPSGVNFADIPPMGRSTVVLASGKIFRGGTLSSDDFDPNDPRAIGIWRCQFVDLGPDDFLDFGLTGAVTYFFQLNGKGHDSKGPMIIVQGLNSHPRGPGGPDVENSVPRVHAVVGGTGKFARVTGEVREEVIGTNLSGNRNLRFKFWLSGVRHRHD